MNMKIAVAHGLGVRAAKKCNIPVPTHEFVVEMEHALEERRQ